MAAQLSLTGFEFSDEDLREAYERSRSCVRHELTFEQVLKNEAVRQALVIELKRQQERRHAGTRRGRHGHYKRHRSH